MSVLNGIGEGSLNELLARRLNTPGGAVAPGVAPEMFPSITLENDRPEWGYLKGEQMGSIARSISGVAGEFGALWISNPFAPNLCTIQSIEVESTSAVAVGLGVYPGGWAGSALGNGVNRDTRFQASNQVIFEAGTTAVLPAVDRFLARITTPRVLQLSIVLRPTNVYGLLVYNNATANAQLAVNVHYRIRGAQPGELR